VKLSIKAELAYSFANATQIIANIEASHTSDQSILSETLDIQPPAKILSDKTASGDRRIRGSLSGNVNSRYLALVENNVRRLLPKSGRQHLWSDLPSEVLAFLLPSRFCPSDKFMRFAQREFGGAGDGVARVMAMLEWIHRNVDYVAGVSNAETTAERTFVDRAGCAATSLIWVSPLRGHWEFPLARLAPTPYCWILPTSTRSSRSTSKTIGG
jgi:transglutaminase-like putative cysteine protease